MAFQSYQMINHINIEYICTNIIRKINFEKMKTFFVSLLILQMHIDEVHNIEQFDQLVEVLHDMQVMNMLQMLIDFFHPILNN